MLHVEKNAKQSEKVARNTFSSNSSGQELPEIKIKDGINIIDTIIKSKFVASKSEIRRLIKSNGIKINNKTVYDEKLILKKESQIENGFLKLSVGKKKHIKLIIV